MKTVPSSNLREFNEAFDLVKAFLNIHQKDSQLVP